MKKFIKMSVFLIICVMVSTYFFQAEKNIDPNRAAVVEDKTINATSVLRKPSSTAVPTNQDIVTTEIKKDIFMITNREKTREIYQEMINYPDYSTPVDHKKSIDYIENKFAPDIKQILGNNDPSVTMVAWSEKNYYSLKDEVIRFYAIFSRKGKNINAQKIKASLNSGVEIQFQSQSLGYYMGELDISQIKTGQYLLQIDANAGGETLTAVSGFKVEGQYYEFDKMKRSFLDSNGNLVFEHQVHILKAGTYLLEGLLYDSRGKIIASAHNAVELAQGLQTINLNFYGYIFYKKKMSGPFNLKNIQLAYVDENLVNHGEQLVVLNAFTDKYDWDQFNSSPFNNPIIDEKLADL